MSGLSMKLSLFTVAVPDLTPDEVVEAVREAGIDGVEWRFANVPAAMREEPPSFWRNNRCTLDPETPPEALAELARRAREKGVESVAIVPYLAVGDLPAAERAMAAAKAMGARWIRAGVPRYDRTVAYHDLFEQAARYLAEVQEMARQYGIRALVETHHETIIPSASLAYRLVSRFDPEVVGVIFDPGNMVVEGYENYRLGLQLLGEYVAHVHVKNGYWERAQGAAETAWRCRWTPVDRGWVDWQQVIADLKSVGYDGYLGVEDFSGAMRSRDMMRHFADYFRSLL